MKIRILAVDCATKPKRTGLAAGRWEAGVLTIDEVAAGNDVDSIADWLSERASENCVLALDAPLGWPRPMERLAEHRAGDPLPIEANDLFRRETDTFVHQQIGKLPLDVGADRIARTAHSALHLLDEVRSKSGLEFRVTTGPYSNGSVALECYPGGTLRAGPWNERGYKGRDGEAIRRRILGELEDVITFGDLPDLVVTSDDVFDAVIAALGAADYLDERCFLPQDAARAEREGWIWVRRPELT